MTTQIISTHNWEQRLLIASFTTPMIGRQHRRSGNTYLFASEKCKYLIIPRPYPTIWTNLKLSSTVLLAMRCKTFTNRFWKTLIQPRLITPLMMLTKFSMPLVESGIKVRSRASPFFGLQILSSVDHLIMAVKYPADQIQVLSPGQYAMQYSSAEPSYQFIIVNGSLL